MDKEDRSTVLEIERIVREGLGTTVTIDGVDYSTTPLHDPRKPEPEPATVELHTLQSLVDFIEADRDGAYTETRGRFVHVESPTEVRLCTDIFGVKNQRVELAHATAIVPSLNLGSWQDPETFNIMLQSHFEETSGRKTALQLVGNLQTEAVQTVADDGVSQQATVRKGIVKVATVEVPNPITLRPYRTFSEVVSPESPFILRLRGGGEGRLPTCALFEADGGQWRLKAIEAIKAWLVAELTDTPVCG